jgi:hypothetical protein
MFNGCEKIYTPVLQTTKDYPKDISYRGKGLSNEYRLSFASGLAPSYKARSAERLLKTPQTEI